MPIYDYCCERCHEITEHLVSIAKREAPRNCPECGSARSAHLQMSAPHYAGERAVGDRRLIWDEKQITSEKGSRWRDEGTTGRPGGAGSKIYFS